MRACDILDAKGRDVVTISPDATLEDAIETLASRNIGAVLVMKGDDLVGVLSERDVVRVLAGAPTGFRDTQVASLMTTDLHTVTEQASVDELMDLMTDRRIRHLPVCEDGKLRGVLSIGDVVKHRIREVASEAAELRSYIGS